MHFDALKVLKIKSINSFFKKVFLSHQENGESVFCSTHNNFYLFVYHNHSHFGFKVDSKIYGNLSIQKDDDRVIVKHI